MINQFLEFEDKAELLSFKFAFKDTLIWPFIRNHLIGSAVRQMSNLQDAHFEGKENLDLKTKLNYIQKAVAKSPFKSDEKDIVMFYSDISNIRLDNGQYYNRLHDDFAKCYVESTLLIEANNNLLHHGPRDFENVVYEDLISLYVKIQSKLRGKVSSEDTHSIKKFLEYIKVEFPYKFDEKFYSATEYIMSKISTNLEFNYSYYMKLFQRIKPKLVFFEDGSYASRAYAIRIAKEMGITTAELQHGLVSLNHVAYNYGKTIFNNSEYKKYLPEYYLTFGEYWGRNIRLPAKIITVGNPYFSKKVSDYSKSLTVAKPKKIKDILIISQWTVTAELVEITKKLADNLDKEKYRIIYRLHPREVGFVERYEALKKYDNVTISTSGDIYDLILESDYIVGVSSTALFEALGFGKAVYIYEHVDSVNHVAKDTGSWFKDAEELKAMILNDVSVKTEADNVWAGNWQSNYKDFIEGVCRLIP